MTRSVTGTGGHVPASAKGNMGPRSAAIAPFLLLTYSLSWTVWIAAWLASGRPPTMTAAPAMIVAIYLGSFAPGLAAALLSLRSGRAAFVAWLAAFVRFRCGWRAYAAAALPLPLAIVMLTWLLGYTPKPGASHGMPAIAFYLTLFPVSLVNAVAAVFLGAGPLGEEGGWRGYLLPRLRATAGEGRASLLVGLAWACWHLPIMAMFADWRGGVSFALYLPLYIAGVTCLSFIMTVVWRLGRGSLVPCIWLHGMVNALGGVAFDQRLWQSRWTLEASTTHMAVAFFIVAVLLWFATRPKVA